MFSQYLHKYFSELRTLSPMRKNKKKHISSHLKYCMSVGQVWVQLNLSWFQPEFALKFLDSIWLFDTFVWLLQLNFFCMCFESHIASLLLNKKVVILYILTFKKQQHGLASMSKCNFPLSSALNWNREFATHSSVWYLIFVKMFCSSGHNFFFEILKGSHATTGQQKGKLFCKKLKSTKCKILYEITWWKVGKYLRCSSGVCSPDQPSETGKEAKGEIPWWVQILEGEKDPKMKSCKLLKCRHECIKVFKLIYWYLILIA